MKNKVIFILILFIPIFLFSQKENKSDEHSFILNLEYRTLQPGEIIKVRLLTEQDVMQAQIIFAGKKYITASCINPKERLAFIGLDLGIKPKTYPLSAIVFFGDGSYKKKDINLQIKSKEFPVKKLWVDEKFVTPPKSADERIRRESNLLLSIYDIYTPDWIGDGSFIIPSVGEAAPNFGEKRYFNNKPRSSHSGVDISTPFGYPVKSSNSGRIVLACDLYFAGKTVIIDHGLGVFSLYCHFSKIIVKRGKMVAKGDIIGEIGSTGRVTGPHLHWGIKIRGKRVDPFSLLSLNLE
jgi:murein DD-endopeptidase MepM/ murein hydrolase activator NlpD